MIFLEKMLDKMDKHANLVPRLLILFYLATLIFPESARQLILYTMRLSDIQLWSVPLLHLFIILLLTFLLGLIAFFLMFFANQNHERELISTITGGIHYILSIIFLLFLIFSYSLKINLSQFVSEKITFSVNFPIFLIWVSFATFFVLFFVGNFQFLISYFRIILEKDWYWYYKVLFLLIYLLVIQGIFNKIFELQFSF